MKIQNPKPYPILLLLLTLAMVTLIIGCTPGQGEATKLPDVVDNAAAPKSTTAPTDIPKPRTVGDAPQGTDEMQLDAQLADQLAAIEAEGEAQGTDVVATRVAAQEAAVASGYAAPADFTSVFYGKWQQPSQPAQGVIVVLNEDSTAIVSAQDITDPNLSTTQGGIWKFEKPGLATIAITGKSPAELKLEYEQGKGLFLRGGPFGDAGIIMGMYTPN